MAEVVDAYDMAVAVSGGSDSTVRNCSGFYVGGAGNVAIVPRNDPTGSAVTLTGCLVGHVYRIAAYKIMQTNTTATNIVALY